jgi:hypothetical protein
VQLVKKAPVSWKFFSKQNSQKPLLVLLFSNTLKTQGAEYACLCTPDDDTLVPDTDYTETYFNSFLKARQASVEDGGQKLNLRSIL